MLLLAVFLVAANPVGFAAPPVVIDGIPIPPFEPNPEFRNAFAKLVKDCKAYNEEIPFHLQFPDGMRAVGGDLIEALAQASYSSLSLPLSDDRRLCGLAYFEAFWNELSENQRVHAIVSLLLCRNDWKAQHAAWCGLHKIEEDGRSQLLANGQQTLPAVYFDALTPVLDALGGLDTSAGRLVVDYMVQENPPEALLYLLGFLTAPDDQKAGLKELNDFLTPYYRLRRGIAASEEYSNNISNQLAQWCRPKPWWLNLYLAEMLRQVPSLRGTAILNSLTGEKNELVQESLSVLELQEKHGIDATSFRWEAHQSVAEKGEIAAWPQPTNK